MVARQRASVTLLGNDRGGTPVQGEIGLYQAQGQENQPTPKPQSSAMPQLRGVKKSSQTRTNGPLRNTAKFFSVKKPGDSDYGFWPVG